MTRCLELDGLVLNLAGQEVTVSGQAHHLTPKECRLLATLMQHAGQILTRDFLMHQVWDTHYTGDTRTLEVHIAWLRGKIEEDTSNPQRILTVRRVGYMFTLSLHLAPDSLPGNEAYLVVVPPGAVPGALPADLVLVGDPYAVTASGALAELEKPAVLKLHLRPGPGGETNRTGGTRNLRTCLASVDI